MLPRISNRLGHRTPAGCAKEGRTKARTDHASPASTPPDGTENVEQAPCASGALYGPIVAHSRRYRFGLPPGGLEGAGSLRGGASVVPRRREYPRGCRCRVGDMGTVRHHRLQATRFDCGGEDTARLGARPAIRRAPAAIDSPSGGLDAARCAAHRGGSAPVANTKASCRLSSSLGLMKLGRALPR